MPNVVEVMQAAGLDVEVVPGWETRKGSRYSWDSSPGGTVGMIVHHTAAGGRADMPCRNICINGRAGLPGPLVQFLLGRSGKLLIISQNRCNHAGKGSRAVLEDLKRNRDITAEFDAGQGAYDAKRLGRGNDFNGGNGVYWGVEVENNGTTEPYPPAQLEALVKLCAAMCQWQGWDHNRIIHHREHTNRKIDMSYRGPLRDMIRAEMSGVKIQIPTDKVPEGDETPETVEGLKRGSRGGQVKIMQKALLDLGFRISVDGIFGRGTEATLKSFQRRNRLRASGVCDEATWAKLRVKQPRATIPPSVKRPYPGKALKRGSRGEDVAWVQKQIGARADGVFGRKTASLVMRYQRTSGLKADGIVGPSTWAALNQD